MALTPEQVRELRRPFTPQAVGFRVDQKFPSDSVRCLVYIDSRLAKERLNDVDPNWTASYEFLGGTQSDPLGIQLFTPIACNLTVCGVTRVGIGQAATKSASGNLIKSAQSDALKRACVEFGVGAYLYALKSFTVDRKGYYTGKDKDGKEVVKGLTRDGTLQLRRDYTKWTQHTMFVDRFGLPTDYGTLEDDTRGHTTTDDDTVRTPAELPSMRKVARA
jgi:hypothetical protein